MDRAAQLAAEARIFLEMERDNSHALSADSMRDATRFMLTQIAADIGFAPNEISAAVDAALTTAGTTP